MSQAEVELRARMNASQRTASQVATNDSIVTVPLTIHIPPAPKQQNTYVPLPGPLVDVNESEVTVPVQVFIPQSQHTAQVQEIVPAASSSESENNTVPVSKEAPQTQSVQPIIYQCEHCSLLFVTESDIRSHLQTHLAPGHVKTYKDAEKNTQKVKAANSQICIPVSPFKKYDCRYCKVSFATKTELQTHKQIHVSDKFECDECGKYFSAKTALILHQRIHTGEKPYACTACGKSFSQSQHLIYHEMSHTGDKPFWCDICDKRFVHMSALTMHIRTHTGEKPYECELCGKRFKQRQHLMYHGQTHSDSKPFHCDICKKDFSHQSSLKTHQKIHRGERPYECEVCQKSFVQKQHLMYHMGIHTGVKQFKCPECVKSFVHHAALKAHIRNNHSETIKDFKCDLCGRTCANLTSFKAHLKMHAGEKPFSCSQCGKAFGQKQHLEYHMMAHSGLKKFRCGLCQKRFIHKSAFKVHNKNTHSDEANLNVDCLKCGLGFDDEVAFKIHHCEKFDQEPTPMPDFRPPGAKLYRKRASKASKSNQNETTVAIEEPVDEVELAPSPSVSENTKGGNSKKVSTPKRKRRSIGGTNAVQADSLGSVEYVSEKLGEGSSTLVSTPKRKRGRKKKSENLQKSNILSNSKTVGEQLPVDSSVEVSGNDDSVMNTNSVTNENSKKPVAKKTRRSLKSPSKSNPDLPKKMKQSRKSATPKRADTTAGSPDNTMSYKCLECCITFLEVSDLIVHIQSHANKSSNDVSIDPKPNENETLVSSVNDFDGLGTNLSGDFECPECEEKFSRMSLLHIHLRKHSVKQPLLKAPS